MDLDARHDLWRPALAARRGVTPADVAAIDAALARDAGLFVCAGELDDGALFWVTKPAATYVSPALYALLGAMRSSGRGVIRCHDGRTYGVWEVASVGSASCP